MGLYLSRCLHRYLGTRKPALAARPLRPRRITQEHRPLRSRPAPRPQDPGICKPAPGHPEPQDRSQAPHKVLHSGDHTRGRRAVGTPPARYNPHRLPLWLLLTPQLTKVRYEGMKRRRRHAPDPGWPHSPFKVQTNPEGPVSLYRCPPSQPAPDPCAKETVLKNLSQCNKGKRKFDGALWFEEPEPKRKQQSPQRRPSAFRPVIRNGVEPSFLPRPGPLKRSVRSRASASVRKRLSPGLPSSLPGASPGPCPTGPSSQASPGHGLTAPAAGLGADVPLSQEPRPRPSSPSQGPGGPC